MADKTVNLTYCQIGTFNNYMHSNKEEPVKNITFNCFKAASCFKGRSDVLKQIQEYIQSNKIVVIHGAPGIGKTETARRFSTQNLDYFDGNIIWLFSDSQENLKKCFNDLSKTLGLKVTDKDDVNVSLIYSKFKLSKSLFIFDNVEKITTISKYLPCSQLHPTVRVLITSQVAPSDSSVAKIQLNPLNMEDTLQILEDKLEEKYFKHAIEIWKDLVTYLEGIPLSTQIVAALINHELAKPVRITKFIGSLKKNFINSKTPDSEIINYNKTVYNSIRFALERLVKENTRYSLDLLRFIAYLDADRIYHPDLLLVPSINESEERLEDALNKLVQYSLIQVENVYKERFKIKVHRTIQLVSRKFDLNERNGTMFKNLMKTIVSTYKMRDKLYNKDILIFIHFQSIYDYVNEEEYKNKSLEFYYENKALAESYLYTLADSRSHQLLQEILPKFRDENIKTFNYSRILNGMLMYSISNLNDLFIINLLIMYGAKIHSIPNETNGFHWASYWLSVELFDRLLESNDPKELINSKDPWERTILHILVQKCNQDIIEKTMKCMDHLISKWNADIFVQAKRGLTLLHVACEKRLLGLAFCKYLVEKHKCKKLVNTQCDEGRTPLQYLFNDYHYIKNGVKMHSNLFLIS